jgi:hypothetical protein
MNDKQNNAKIAFLSWAFSQKIFFTKNNTVKLFLFFVKKPMRAIFSYF